MEILTKITNNIIPHNNFLSDLDRAVLNNDEDKIKYLLKLGNTIYKQDLVSNKSLCSNSLNKFIKNHNECINMICFKSSLYYSFIYNNYLTTNIFKFLLNIHNNNYKFNSDYNQQILNLINKLKLSGCICNQTYSFKEYYNYNFLNFLDNKIILFDLMPRIIKEFNKIVISSQFEKINLMSKSNDNIMVCFHTHDTTKLDTLVVMKNIINLWDNYIVSCNILTILYNQQFFEIIKLKYNQKNIKQMLNFIFHKDLISLDYLNTGLNKTIFDYLINSYNNYDFLKFIFDLQYTSFSDDVNILNYYKPMDTIIDLIKNKFFENIHFLIDNLPNKCFSSDYETFFINIINFDMSIIEKSKILISLIEKQNIVVTYKILENIINSNELTHEIIEKFLLYDFNRQIFNNILDYNLIKLIVIKRKYKELDIFLSQSKNNNLVYFQKMIEPNIIFDFLNIIRDENDDAMILLETICNYVDDINLRNPLMSAVKKNKVKFTKFLFEHNSNPFIKNSEDYNSLHFSILVNNTELFKILINAIFEGKQIIYELFNNMDLFEFIIEYSRKKIEYINILLNTTIDLTLFSNGRFLHYIILHPNLLPEEKKYIVNILFQNKQLDNIFYVDDKPIILDAIENNLYGVVLLFMNYLICRGEIDIGGIGHNYLFHKIQKGDLDIRRLKYFDKVNYYKIVSNYLINNKVFIPNNIDLIIMEDNKELVLEPSVIFKLKDIGVSNKLFKLIHKTLE